MFYCLRKPSEGDGVKKPNFFIIGAPKCGTTSLAAWLSEHPNIYMSPLKEPHFFNMDLKYHNVSNSRDYWLLFDGVTSEHKAVGEASVFYLFSKTAVPRIEKEVPGAKYIVMVRNPVDMAYSLHEQQVVAGNEHIKDFAQAWHLSEKRAKGQEVTRWCREPKLLDYKSVCKLGEQLERLFKIVPRERVLVLVLDDVKENPRREYLKVLNFLGVSDDGRTEFPVYNPAKERRWPWLRRAVLAMGRASRSVKKALGIPTVRGTGILNRIDKLNIRYRPRPPMPPELRAEITEYFRDDVLLLSRLLDRDFSTWLKLENNG